MSRKALSQWIVPGVVAIAVVAALVVWQWPTLTADTATQDATTLAQQPTNQADQGTMAKSVDHVQVTARRKGDQLIMLIQIDKGWHLNANPASLDFLIPTEIKASSMGNPVPTEVDYPPGHTLDVGLEQPISVYSDRIRITARLPELADDTPLEAAVKVQACSNEGRCLIPSTLHMPVQADQADNTTS